MKEHAVGNRIRVILADDNTILRTGLQHLLDATGDIQVVAEASTAAEALQVIQAIPCDIVLSNGALPSADKLSLTRQLRVLYPALKVMVLSVDSSDVHVVQALRAGARACLPQSTAFQHLVDAIKVVQTNGFHIGPTQAGPIIAELQSQAPPSPDNPRNLTRRELEVLDMIAAGLSNDHIARTLHVSQSTVKSHLRTLYRKLDATGRTQAILRGMRSGLIANPDTVK